jgi:hypothetical protein
MGFAEFLIGRPKADPEINILHPARCPPHAFICVMNLVLR